MAMMSGWRYWRLNTPKGALTAGAALLMVVGVGAGLSACGSMNVSEEDVVGSFSSTCDHGNRVYVATRAIAVVAGDPTC